VVTQQELFDRVAGNIPTVWTLHLLKSIPIPYVEGMVLDEIQYSGYSPTVMTTVVSTTVSGGKIAVSNASCTFQPATGYVGPFVAGFAVTCLATDGSNIVVAIAPTGNGLIDPSKVTGNYLIQWSVQKYDGP
jgi:hypothetical protein